MKYGIFCKPRHVEKIVNFLNKNTDIDYFIISTSKTNQHEVYYRDFDIGVSYCCGFIIDLEKEKKIKGKNSKWFNYHPHPLPDYKGYSAYAKAIKNGVMEYGVTLHRLVQETDAGQIIKIKKFQLETPPIHSSELGNICHYYLFQLFKETVESLSKIDTGGNGGKK